MDTSRNLIEEAKRDGAIYVMDKVNDALKEAILELDPKDENFDMKADVLQMVIDKMFKITGDI